MTGRICGTGSCVPSFVMDNNDIAKLVDTSDEWIRERTGVVRRHIIREETTVSMAVQAGRQALENAGITADDVDLIIVSTISSNVILPCTACEVQRELGAKRATCFDLSAACTGFVVAYNTAAAYLNAGVYQTALIIGSESLSNLTNWKDRGTCILFGDGAGAAVVTAADHGMEGFVQWSDGVSGEVLTCPGKKIENPWKENDSETEYIQMNGQEVFRFAVKKVPECIRQVTEKTETQIETIDWFILHQANSRIIQSVAKRLGVPEEKFPMNMEQYGNTSAASIPILLDEMNKKGMLQPGQKIILSGFGAGLTWGAAQIEW